MITEEQFGVALNLERLGFEKCTDYEHYGQVYKMKYNDATVYVDFMLLKGKFHGISAHLCFEIIENLSKKLIEKFNINLNQGIDIRMTITPTKLIPNIESAFKKNQKAQKNYLKPENIQEIANLAYEYLIEIYQPYWEKYSSLQVVNDEIIDGIHDDKITDYLPIFASFKKLMIMKMCNNSKYNEYIDWIYNALKERNEHGKSIEYYQAIVELKDILETGTLEDYA